MRKIIVMLAAVAAIAAPVSLDAWGFEAHKFVMDRAIGLLPVELRPLFERHRATVVERSVDPDTWIAAGWEEERPRHFLDMDSEGFGAYPFAALPRDYTTALAKFGAAKMREAGTLPWRTEEVFGSLRRSFEAYGRRPSVFAQNDIIMCSAWLAHYTADGHVPLHGVSNYDGQLTQQWGLHARWESIMFEQYHGQLTVVPRAIPPVRTPREFMFDALLRDTQLVPALLQTDKEAIGGRDVYDDTYYAAFFKANKPVMEARLGDSIAAVAAMITGAWEAAGKPAIPVNPPGAPQRRRRP
jgi:hypothetical protein